MAEKRLKDVISLQNQVHLEQIENRLQYLENTNTSGKMHVNGSLIFTEADQRYLATAKNRFKKLTGFTEFYDYQVNQYGDEAKTAFEIPATEFATLDPGARAIVSHEEQPIDVNDSSTMTYEKETTRIERLGMEVNDMESRNIHLVEVNIKQEDEVSRLRKKLDQGYLVRLLFDFICLLED